MKSKILVLMAVLQIVSMNASYGQDNTSKKDKDQAKLSSLHKSETKGFHEILYGVTGAVIVGEVSQVFLGRPKYGPVEYTLTALSGLLATHGLITGVKAADEETVYISKMNADKQLPESATPASPSVQVASKSGVAESH